jgi:tRNA(Ser,Leu) C12 N-acetylase TAN1
MLNSALENAKRVLKKDKDRRGFEELRVARHDLDTLTQKKENSSEVSQAYKLVNKDDEITNTIKKLAELI